ncbi:MAG: hypothetical protein PHI12_13260 [Dehalococcoidales bacterium]|nr:hypothetical protein [Dehalococcoidales bacterium]
MELDYSQSGLVGLALRGHEAAQEAIRTISLIEGALFPPAGYSQIRTCTVDDPLEFIIGEVDRLLAVANSQLSDLLGRIQGESCKR